MGEVCDDGNDNDDDSLVDCWDDERWSVEEGCRQLGPASSRVVGGRHKVFRELTTTGNPRGGWRWSHGVSAHQLTVSSAVGEMRVDSPRGGVARS